jgi:hypothetical protein
MEGSVMGDIGNSPYRRASLEVGDCVRVRGVSPTSDEYDVGTVVGFTFNGVRVRWTGAAEVYTEDRDSIERIDGAPGASS